MRVEDLITILCELCYDYMVCGLEFMQLPEPYV